ncbi:MAG: DUF1987 domain-containing protein [Bacteroidales bacterium]|nr:DUF1987 domain-containing protein [Bacteroidales bacterium]MCB8999844.1 DUF1987 domain-containing protein [Bacteroidales bacterium]MCB9012647.1 DUF1987 domain-containing protein [Bacteroidales bacterium]
MNSLIINEMDDSPKVKFTHEDGKLELSGKSLPEDVSAFYAPILEWLENYALNPQPLTEITFKLTYFNTASSKLILDMLTILEKMSEEGKNVVVNWYYPEYDEDMRDAGQEYSEMVDVPFKHISYNP